MQPGVVLGLDFGGSKTAAAVTDTSGARLGEVVTPIDPDAPADETFARGIAAAQDLLREAAAGHELAAVGACTFGIPHDDRVDLAPNIAGWERLAFGAGLRGAFPGAEVRIATDVKAAASAEVAHGALAGCDPGLYINLGTGFAIAIVVGGAVLGGRHAAAGEIGYNLRSADAPPGTGRLEDVVSGKALEAAARRFVGRPDVGALFERAGRDTAAADICAQFVAELCFHVVNLTIAVDPQRVVVGGGLVRSWDRFGPAVAQALADTVPFPPELMVAAHPFDAPLLGALALGLSAVPDYPTVTAVLSEGAPA
jgi:glucokinase